MSAIHLSDSMTPEFVACGILCTPSVKRTQRFANVTCKACLLVEQMADDATKDKPAPAAPVTDAATCKDGLQVRVTDAEIEAAIRGVSNDAWEVGYAVGVGTSESRIQDRKANCELTIDNLRALIARRVQQATAAAEDLRKRYDHITSMMMFQSQVVLGALAGKRIEGSDLLAQRQGHFTEGDMQLLELVRRVAAAEDLARAVEAIDAYDVDRAGEQLQAALAAFRKAQGGGK